MAVVAKKCREKAEAVRTSEEKDGRRVCAKKKQLHRQGRSINTRKETERKTENQVERLV